MANKINRGLQRLSNSAKALARKGIYAIKSSLEKGIPIDLYFVKLELSLNIDPTGNRLAMAESNFTVSSTQYDDLDAVGRHAYGDFMFETKNGVVQSASFRHKNIDTKKVQYQSYYGYERAETNGFYGTSFKIPANVFTYDQLTFKSGQSTYNFGLKVTHRVERDAEALAAVAAVAGAVYLAGAAGASAAGAAIGEGAVAAGAAITALGDKIADIFTKIPQLSFGW